MGQQAVTLQRGIWIDQQRLAEAGLQDPFEISVQPGEIRIRSGEPNDDSEFPMSGTVERSVASEVAWEAFRSLGDAAASGRLADPSVHHDRYLYGASQ